MKILVLMKAVASGSGGYTGADRQTAELIPNPADITALEEALKLRDSLDCSVDVLSMGPGSVGSMLRDALARGADRAILLSDPAFAGADTAATSRSLAAAIRKLGCYDLILCGKKTTDGETGQVGPELAVRLGIECITDCCELSVSALSAECRCQTDNGTQLLHADLPLLLTIRYGINSPRLPSLMGLRRAKREEPVLLSFRDLNISADRCGIKGSPTQVLSSCSKPFEKRHPVIIERSCLEKAASMLTDIRNGGTAHG